MAKTPSKDILLTVPSTVTPLLDPSPVHSDVGSSSPSTSAWTSSSLSSSVVVPTESKRSGSLQTMGRSNTSVTAVPTEKPVGDHPTTSGLISTTTDTTLTLQTAVDVPQPQSQMKVAQVDVETGQPQPKSTEERLRQIIRNNLMVVLLIAALVLGIIMGGCLRLREEPYSKRERMYIRFPGEILMNMLKFLILPLIMTSLISGVTSLDTRSSGKIGAYSVAYYLSTTLAAVILGIILVISIEPGKRGDKPEGKTEFRDVNTVDTFLDLIRQMFPDNLVEAAFQKTLTNLKEVKEPPPKPVATTEPPSKAADDATAINATTVMTTANTTTKSKERILEPVLEVKRGINMLGLVVFSLAVGLAINAVGPKAAPIRLITNALTEVTLVLIKVVIWYSPFGVLFLVAAEMVSMKDPWQMFEQLAFYFITVMLGLSIHGFVSLPALYFFICRRSPYQFMYGMLQALITAVGTASSLATLPVTMRNLEENLGLDPRVTGFVAPVGATINMDGTALYEAVAVIFIGQVEGFDLSFSNIIVICLTATAAAIGAAGVPQAGLVTMVIVLSAVGFPSDKVGLILAIDWLLDRFRTAINVLGDAFGAGIVQELCKADLARMDEEDKLRALEEAEAFNQLIFAK